MKTRRGLDQGQKIWAEIVLCATEPGLDSPGLRDDPSGELVGQAEAWAPHRSLVD